MLGNQNHGRTVQFASETFAAKRLLAAYGLAESIFVGLETCEIFAIVDGLDFKIASRDTQFFFCVQR